MIEEDKAEDDYPGEADFPIVFSDIEDITLVDTIYTGQRTGLSREEAIDLSHTTSRLVLKPLLGKAKSTANDP